MSPGPWTGAIGLGAVAWLVMTWPAAAQIVPETSGSSWFYSPSHRSPFNQFADPAPARVAPHAPPCRHAEHIRKRERPC